MGQVVEDILGDITNVLMEKLCQKGYDARLVSCYNICLYRGYQHLASIHIGAWGGERIVVSDVNDYVGDMYASKARWFELYNPNCVQLLMDAVVGFKP